MNKGVKRFIPRWIKILYLKIVSFPGSIEASLYDLRRYRKYYNKYLGYSKPGKADYLEAAIFFLLHSLEKGLSLTNRRKEFGKEKVEKLVVLLRAYVDEGNPSSSTCFKSALAGLSEYAQLRHKECLDAIPSLNTFLDAYDLDDECKGGTGRTERNEILSKAMKDFRTMSSSRHSVRNFSSKPVQVEKIFDAVEIAQRSPSACNRQPWRVHIFSKKEDILGILKIQKGANGFDDEVSILLAITVSLASCIGTNERNQLFVEGGIFVMSLIYALHYLGLGTCCLNWSKAKKADRSLRSLAEIPEEEAIIVLLAVGNLPDHFLITESSRKRCHEIVSVHE